MPPQRSTPDGPFAAWPWIAFMVLASLLLSRAFACATPFAALATLGAVTLRDREAIGLVLAVWLDNQIVGFGLMHYPWTASTLGWGLAIGLAALAAWAAARWITRALDLLQVAALAAGLAGAYAAYELVLVAATAVLPSGPGVFAAAVVLRIFAINAAALVLLGAARLLAGAAGVPTATARRAARG